MKKCILFIVFLMALSAFAQEDDQLLYKETIEAQTKEESAIGGELFGDDQRSGIGSFGANVKKENAPLQEGEEEGKLPVVIDGDEISYMQGEGRVIAKGNVHIVYKETELFCEEAAFDVNSNIAVIPGDFKILKDGALINGRDVVYDFSGSHAEMKDIRIEDPPMFGVAETGSKQGDNKYVLERGYMTTCDLNIPHWRFTAKKVSIYTGDKIVAKNIVMRVGKAPIFYIPYYSHSLKDDAPPIELAPGKSKEWGGYALFRYRYHLDEERKHKGRVILDWYQKRGIGTGLTYVTEDKNYGKLLAKGYFIQDDIYKLDAREKLFSMYPERSSLPEKRLEDDRYKMQLAYSWEPTEKLSIKTEFNRFSDPYFMRDFFEREYDVAPTDKTYMLIDYSLSNSALSLLGENKVNPYESGIEYLPQMEYNFFTQELAESNFYIKSDNKIGYLRQVTAYSDKYPKAVRINSDSSLSYSNRFGWFTVDPFVGAQVTYYSTDAIDQKDLTRVFFKSGANVTTKLYRVFDGEWNWFGEKIDKLRHVMTPEIEYVYNNDPTIANTNILQFDEVDSAVRAETMTFTFKNKLQAKAGERTWDFLYFSPSAVFTINEKGTGCYWTSIYTDFEVYPREGLSMTLRNNYSFQTRRFTSIEADFTIKGKKKVLQAGEEVDQETYSFSYGQRYTRRDKSQGTIDWTYQLTPKLMLKSYLRYEYNREDFAEQQYAIRADLHCWWMELGVDFNRHERGGKDLNFWVVFTMKAFPDMSLGFDQTYRGAKPSYSE